jgi:hypothetical protein
VLSSTSTLAIATLTASTLAIMPARAQTPAQTIAEIASYQGPDRMERLIAGAKKEGVLSVYGSSVLEDMKPISDAFKAKYGIDFQYWRASSENLVQRTVAETRAGRCLVDGSRRSRPSSRRCIAKNCCRRSRRRSPPA